MGNLCLSRKSRYSQRRASTNSRESSSCGTSREDPNSRSPAPPQSGIQSSYPTQSPIPSPQQTVPSTGSVVTIKSEADFANRMRKAAGKLVVIDFYAPWCHPCNIIAPEIAKVASKNPEVVFLKIDIQEFEEIAFDYNIRTIPTFYFLKNGKILDSFSGANIERILALVKKYK